MKLYQRMIAPVLYYPGQNHETKKKYLEDPVRWYPEEMIEELEHKYKKECELGDRLNILFGFDTNYVAYAEELKFKKIKVPEKCGECKSCNIMVTGSSYCHMAAISPENPQMNISTIYIDVNSRPVWCPIIKMNEELDKMPIKQRSNFEKIITRLSSLWGDEYLWE